MFDELENSLSPDLKAALPYLMIGGGGAALGGLASGARHARDGETRVGYAARLARNMALAGTLAGGGAYALHQGVTGLNDSLDHDNPMTGSDPTVNPVADKIRGVAFSPLTAGITGIGTLAATNGPTAEAYTKARRAAVLQLFPDHKDMGVSALENLEPKHIETALALNRPGMERVLTGAGIPVQEAKAKLGMDALSHFGNAHLSDYVDHQPSNLLEHASDLGERAVLKVGPTANKAYQFLERQYRPTLGRLLGQHRNYEQLGRIGLGGVAALAPALIGSLLTDPAPSQQ